MASPFVTVLIPTYNYGHFISEAIESVLMQDLPCKDIEVLVVDDGSTDETAAVVSRYGSSIRYLSQKNEGKAAATRTGIGAARGKYIFNLDADDLFLPHKIRTVLEVFESDSAISHVAHPALCWQGEKRVAEQIPEVLTGHAVNGNALLQYFYVNNIFFGGGSTFAARADDLRKLAIPAAIDIAIDEYLVLVAAGCGHSFILSEPLSLWRIHGQNFSIRHDNPVSGESKIHRVRSSREALVREIDASDLPTRVKELVRFKSVVQILTLKERDGSKSGRDIVALLRLLVQSPISFGVDTPRVIRSHHALRRLLPNSAVSLLRRGISKLQQQRGSRI